MERSEFKAYSTPELETLDVRNTRDIEVEIGVGVGIGLGS